MKQYFRDVPVYVDKATRGSVTSMCSIIVAQKKKSIITSHISESWYGFHMCM